MAARRVFREISVDGEDGDVEGWRIWNRWIEKWRVKGEMDFLRVEKIDMVKLKLSLFVGTWNYDY
ncbi:hypothetical protein L195_g009309 [Trifolium pratense]|uniref:Uncharacterized protein n=1 Tax=Trifolium pratense TaxID=57577 RepID=A0A2K3PBP0_TRIPR|nr:hypothetical protein L195_g009309 [Trifolium pratense]